MRLAAMCEKCQEIDRKIERYRTLAKQVSDPMTHEEAKKLIDKFEAEKGALHPERNE
jgi:hypothetical protein